MAQTKKLAKPSKMSFGKLIGYSLLFIFQYLGIGFLVFCFANIFVQWTKQPFTSPPPPPVGLEAIIALILTVPFFIWRQRATRRKSAGEVAAIATAENARAQVLKEIRSEQIRKSIEFDRASRERAEVHERIVEAEREKRAKEIKALERELTHYKNIPGELNENVDE